ncbi:MAG TPA: N-acetylmuramoyl-L-alanine amidase-like domain-containing protein [Thermoanaerobaculia bacterium]|nr:N-acetylmuramoyl-L-alanine amidase-like domain-containing protein [Thermoanaerobaculia bacterium]
MTKTRPRGPDVRRVGQLLSLAKPHSTVPARMEVLSASLVGCPYEAHGLVGSATDPEVFTASLERFDCVTYVETVLALARAADPAGFADELRGIRYQGGRVEWARRNHYMTDWVRRNARAGIVRPVAAGALATRKEKSLNAVAGLAVSRARFSCVPKTKLGAFSPRLKNGDVVLFASTKAGLDVFHCGLLAFAGGRWMLRHASRSQGRVVEEDLASFLRANRTAGLIAARPLDVAASAPKGAA